MELKVLFREAVVPILADKMAAQESGYAEDWELLAIECADEIWPIVDAAIKAATDQAVETMREELHRKAIELAIFRAREG